MWSRKLLAVCAIALAMGLSVPSTSLATTPGSNGSLAVGTFGPDNPTRLFGTDGSPGAVIKDVIPDIWNRDGTGLVGLSTAGGRQLYAPDGSAKSLGALDPGIDSSRILDVSSDRLVYLAYTNTGWELRSRTADGTDSLIHSSSTADGLVPALSPDGKQLAYERTSSSGGPGCTTALLVMDVSSGATSEPVTCAPDPNPNSPPGPAYLAETVVPQDFSPDGRKIVYLRTKRHCDACAHRWTYTLEVVNADGGTPTVLATFENNGEQAPTAASFSPDGRFVAYTVVTNGPPASSTVSFAALGAATAPASFTVPSVAYGVVWQPLPLTISGPLGPTSDSSPSFEFTGAGPFECRLDYGDAQGSWAPCSSPHQLNGLAPGSYDLLVRSQGSSSPATVQSFVVVEDDGSGTAPEQGEVKVPDFDLDLFAGDAVDASVLEAIDAAQALGDGLSVDATSPVDGTMQIEITDSPGTGAVAGRRAAGSRLLASGSARVGPTQGETVELVLGPAAEALERSGSVATKAKVRVRFTPRSGPAVSKSAVTTAVLAAGQPLRSVSLARYTLQTGGKLRAKLEGRRRGPFTAQLRLSAEGAGKATKLGRVKLKRGRGAATIRLPRSVRAGSYRLSACAKPKGRAPRGAKACVSAPETLAVATGAVPAALPAAGARGKRRVGGSDLEALLQGVYLQQIRPAVAAAHSANPPSVFTHAEFERRFRITMGWLQTAQLNGVAMPATTMDVVNAHRELGLLVVDNALADCRAGPSIGLARNYLVQSTTAEQSGVPVPAATITTGFDHCLRFRLDYDIHLREEGTFLGEENQNADPYVVQSQIASKPAVKLELPLAPDTATVPWEGTATRELLGGTCTVPVGGVALFASRPSLPDGSLTTARDGGDDVTFGLELGFGPPGAADFRTPGPGVQDPGCPGTQRYRQVWTAALAMKACIRPFGDRNSGDEPVLFLDELTGKPSGPSATEKHAGQCYAYNNFLNRPAKLAWDATFTITHDPT